MLAEAQITDRKPGSPQGSEQLVAVVSQGLQPLGVLGAHGEHAAMEAERAAVGGKLVSGNPRPGLPEGRQAARPPPLML